MPNLRATWAFEVGKHGWSESLVGVGTYEDVLGSANVYSQLRMKLCGFPVVQPYTRVSDDSVAGDVMVSAQPAIVPAPSQLNTDGTLKDLPGYLKIDPARNGACDRPYSSILLRMQSGEKARRSMYLRGIPDTIITNGEYPEFDDAWKKAFDDWAKHVREKWNFMGLDQTVMGANKKAITFVTTGELGRREWVMRTGVDHGLQDGDRVLVRGNKGLHKGTPLNGHFVVEKKTPTEVYLLGSFGDDRAIITAKGAITKLVPTLLPITSVKIIRCVSRRTGRPFGSPRGRRSKRRN